MANLRVISGVAMLAMPVVVAVVAGCGATESAAPTPSPSSSPNTTLSPVAVGSPTGPVTDGASGLTRPVMPAAAKGINEKGAEAFVRHFWETVNYAQQTGDSAALQALSGDGCKTCEAGMASISGVYDQGGRFLGGDIEARSIDATIMQAGEQQIAEVTVDVTQDAGTVEYPDRSQKTKAASFDEKFLLVALEGVWFVAQLEITQA